MSFASEKQPRRKFLGTLGIAAGSIGFLAGASAPGPHNILSETHLDAAFGSPVLGDIIYAENVPTPLNWRRLPAGIENTILKTVNGRPQWLAGVTNGAHIEGTNGLNTPISSVTDGVAAINLGAGRSSFNQTVLYDAVAQIITADNSSLVWTGEVHDSGHAILDTFSIVLPATGVGNIFNLTVPIKGLDTTPIDGSYHISTVTITLNGGTITILNRVLWGRAV